MVNVELAVLLSDIHSTCDMCNRSSGSTTKSRIERERDRGRKGAERERGRGARRSAAAFLATAVQAPLIHSSQMHRYGAAHVSHAPSSTLPGTSCCRLQTHAKKGKGKSGNAPKISWAQAPFKGQPPLSRAVSPN